MTGLGVLGAVLGLLAWRFAVVERTRLRAAIFIIAWLIHVAMGVVFYLYTVSSISDSYAYYYDADGLYSQGIGIGTPLITFIVQSLKERVGGSFLDYFLLFQSFGFFGIAILMRIFEDVFRELRVKQPAVIYGMLFLPSLQFWTSSIGKDGPIFTGICLALWAAMNVRSRWLWLGLGILIVLVIRPHVALIMAAAVTGSLLLDRATGPATRVALVIAAVGGMVFALATIRSTFAVDLTDANSVSDYLASQAQILDTDDAGNTVVQGNLAVKAFSLLFRPFFIDAEGAFGLIASLENLIFCAVYGTLLWRFRDTAMLVRRVTFLRYAFWSGLGIAVLLTVMYYNVGLGLRQKTMFMPSFLLLYAGVLGIRKVAPSVVTEPQAPNELAQPSLARG